MDSVGRLVERGVTVLAQESALVEGDDGTAMITGDVPDGLYGTGVLDDIVIRTTVKTQSLTGYRHIESDELVVLEDLNVFDSCFLWQFCQIVGCFHSCSMPPSINFCCKPIITREVWNNYGSDQHSNKSYGSFKNNW